MKKFEDLLEEVTKQVSSEIKKESKSGFIQNNEEQAPIETKKEKENSNPIPDVYQSNLDELNINILNIFKELEKILFQIARGNIGLFTVRSVLGLINLLIQFKKIYSKRNYILRSNDRMQLSSLHKRLFTFNRTFLINALTKDPVKKQNYLKTLNNK